MMLTTNAGGKEPLVISVAIRLGIFREKLNRGPATVLSNSNVAGRFNRRIYGNHVERITADVRSLHDFRFVFNDNNISRQEIIRKRTFPTHILFIIRKKYELFDLR